MEQGMNAQQYVPPGVESFKAPTPDTDALLRAH